MDDFQTLQDWRLYEPPAAGWAQRGMRRFTPDGVPGLREGSKLRLPPLTRKLSATDTCLQRENLLSAVESRWVSGSHWRAGPTPSSKWPTQKEHNGIFVDVFVSFCFEFCFNFCLLGLLLVYFHFGMCVCMCLGGVFLVCFCFFVCWFSTEKEHKVGWVRDRKELGRTGGEKNMTKIYCMIF